jgi:isopenicillin N synthase-like dioxygenase
MSIPSIDLHDFTQGTTSTKNSFVEKLGNAFENVGFVAVKNHGISDDLISSLYSVVQEFFSLPLSKKKQYEIASLSGQRGYTSFGTEHAKGSHTPDLKEFFQYGQLIKNDFTIANYPPNILVKEITTFNAIFDDAYSSFEKSGTSLLQAIALYLGLNESYFDEFVADGNSILRSIHYPPITSAPKSAIRAEQHEDINLITLLIGASSDGIEILTK